MLIVTADDYGRERLATDSILLCGSKGRITSASAMVFMQDSERAAVLAGDSPVEFGLHLNFTEPLDGTGVPDSIRQHLTRARSFLRLHRLAPVFFNPRLQTSFRILFEAQRDEFERRFKTQPRFYNGHHHMHLCANVLLGGLIPETSCIRSPFTFEAGEKSVPNRLYRGMLRRWIGARYTSTDSFYSVEPAHDLERLRLLIDRQRPKRSRLRPTPTILPSRAFS